MAQDFAKQRQAPAPANRKATRMPQRPAKRAPWNWYFSGMFSGALLMVFAYYGYARYQTLTQESPAAEAIAEAQEEMPNFVYGFYNELATAEVTVDVPAPAETDATPSASAAVVPAKTTSAEVPGVSYLLQAGSFQDRQDAEERRAKIILLNMDAQVSAGVVSGRTWYRVQVGPFPNRGGAEAARNQLSASNIDSIPLLMR
jgi:cell division protein FtsN